MIPMKRLGAVLFAVALAAAATSVSMAGGGAARTRPGGGGGGGGGGGHAAGHTSGRPGGGTAQGHASGHATYGYYHGSGGGWWGYPGYYPGYGYGYDGWWGPYWSLGFYWGWPSYYGYPYGCYGGPCYGYGGSQSLPPSPAWVATDVKPKKAKLYLDGESIGEARDFNGTWDVLPLDPGDHVLRFEAPGYKTLEVPLRARSGRNYRLDYALEKGEGLDPRSQAPPPAEPAVEPRIEAGVEGAAPADPGGPSGGGIEKGFLRLRATPADAAIYLDGAFLGQAGEIASLHGAIPVAVGEHRIEIVRPGFKSRQLRVEVGKDRPADVEAGLERAD